jgi:hypothetical protein
MSLDMTALRLISLPLHGALEMLLGLLVMVAPLALGASTAGAVLGVVTGALLVGLGLSSAAADSDPRRPMSIAAHHELDYGLALGLLGTAVLLGLVGDRIAALLLAAAALTQLALNATTRYSSAR